MRLLKATPAKVLMPQTFEVFVVPSVLLVEPTESDEVDELTPENAVSALSAVARPVSKSDVLILAAVLAAAPVANVASHSTTISPAAWLLLLRVAAE